VWTRQDDLVGREMDRRCGRRIGGRKSQLRGGRARSVPRPRRAGDRAASRGGCGGSRGRARGFAKMIACVCSVGRATAAHGREGSDRASARSSVAPRASRRHAFVVASARDVLGGGLQAANRGRHGSAGVARGGNTWGSPGTRPPDAEGPRLFSVGVGSPEGGGGDSACWTHSNWDNQ